MDSTHLFPWAIHPRGRPAQVELKLVQRPQGGQVLWHGAGPGAPDIWCFQDMFDDISYSSSILGVYILYILYMILFEVNMFVQVWPIWIWGSCCMQGPAQDDYRNRPGRVGMPTWCWRPVLAAGRMALRCSGHEAMDFLGKNGRFLVNMCGYCSNNGKVRATDHFTEMWRGFSEHVLQICLWMEGDIA